ncbi:MAG: glycosyltransferase [bacterium]
MTDFMFEPYWIVLLLLLGLVYLVVLVKIRRGISRLPTTPAESVQNPFQPVVSVIIPCRNEARHIAGALDDLAQQDYPAHLLQIIVVDDRSVDETGRIAESFIGRIADLRVLRVLTCPPDISPKKHAIKKGMEIAEGEIVITTDGDCRFQKGWVRSLIDSFQSDVGVVTGLTIFDRGCPEPFWQRMQQLDYLSHSFIAAGAIGAGCAFNGNGSNLAIRRRAFAEAGGYSEFQNVITGDDTLLLQRLRRQGKWRIHFCAKPESIVRSWPAETPAEVLQQRLRWGSGGLSYTSTVKSFAIMVFILFLALLLSPGLWIAGVISAFWWLALALKVLADVLVMQKGFQVFNVKRDWWAFLTMEVIHIPAILLFSVGGHLFGFRWKGERFRRRRNSPAAFNKAEAV